MTEISQRLKLIASCVPEGSVVADIGTDHAYMPIYLIQNKLASRVIAMDVRRGPLEKAVNNISEAGVSDGIEVRLSDGLSALEPGEASVITISGMGGKLMERILTAGKDKISSDTRLIFSPQSEIAHFREYLINEGFITDDEKMLKEDGKYYVIIICHYGNASDTKDDSMYDGCIDKGCTDDGHADYERVYSKEIIRYANLKYGRKLIARRDETLHEFAKGELSVYTKLKNKLQASPSTNAGQRMEQIDKQIQAIRYVLESCKLLKTEKIMTVKDIIDVLERLSPPDAACGWDNVGLMAGDSDAPVSKILVTLDVDEDAIDKAAGCGADMIVSHHPLIFKGIKSVTSDSLTGRRLITLIRNNISCFAMHTNFDICGSMGQAAADVLGLKGAVTLEVTREDGNGLGKIADVTDETVITVAQWAEKIKKSFDVPTVKVFGDMDKKIYRLAIYPGSGSDAIRPSIEDNADLLVTGDIGHHAGIDAAAQGLAVIDAGHYGIEHVFIKFIADYIREKLPGMPVVEADIKNPFQVI